MEEIVEEVTVGTLVENLISLLRRVFSLMKGVEEDAENLSGTLSAIQVVLEDAETNQFKDKAIRVWLRELKNAAYDAEDVLDKWSVQARSRDLEFTNAGGASQVSRSLSTLFKFHVLFRHIIVKDLKKILRTFDDIAAQKDKFLLNTNNVLQLQTEPEFNKNKETTPRLTEPRLYGRDGDKKNVIDILLDNANTQNHVSICPILGMGGLGKTTLAQLVYNDARVVTCFQVRIWVCVSEPFDVATILKAIIEAFEKQPCDLKTLERIQSKVGEILRDKRYLVVLDDVWNENHDEWNKLKAFLDGGAKGSSIIVTTRLETVASLTGASLTYRLEVLSDDDCWSLLKHLAFDGRVEAEYSNLVEIGMEIVKKCKGLPIAVKALGGLLRSKTNETQWKLVRDDETWNLEGGEKSILPALRLSYNHLPSRLKQCFAFGSIFPKHHEMEKTKLIYLWIANGFIQSQTGTKLEEIGDDMFNELLRLSFFQDTIKDGYGNVETCKMHDLMHDLACSVTVDECLIVDASETKNVPETIRHLSIVCNSAQSSTVLAPCLPSHPSLRTLTFFVPVQLHNFTFPSTLRVLDLSRGGIESLPPSICVLKYLRYLDLSRNFIKKLPESIQTLKNLQMLDLSDSELITSLPYSIGKLVSLKYLNLSRCEGIRSLPESICGLRNLKSLVLKHCWDLKALPENIGNMSGLRHLDLDGCLGLVKMPIGIGQLTSLQTLKCFVVGSESGCGGISELHGLNQLKGELEIRGLQNVRNGEDGRKANLKGKHHLTKLVLCWWGAWLEISNSKEVLEGLLQLPPNLQRLEIHEYQWETRFPQGSLINLDSLKSLEIRWCHSLTSMSDWLQYLTSLERLEIYSCSELVFSGQDFRHLISLRHLHLEHLPKLTALPDGMQHLSMLQSLHIYKCENLTRLPEWMKQLTALRSLSIINCHPDLHKNCEKTVTRFPTSSNLSRSLSLT